MLDLDYAEDSTAETDANFVMTGSGGLVEVQGTAEGAPFSEAQLLRLLALARGGVDAIGDDAEERDRGVAAGGVGPRRAVVDGEASCVLEQLPRSTPPPATAAH